MSVFNGDAYLAKAVESILGQGFADFEFLIIDDGSSDDTAQVLARYAHSDDRIRVLAQENQGLIASLNRGVSQAGGRYIARMDADDISLPNRLAQQVAFLESAPEIGVVGGQVVAIDEHDRSVGPMHYATDHAEVARRMREEGCAVAHPAVMMRRDLVVAVGGYRSAYKHAEDYDLWLRLLEHAGITNLSNTVLRYRSHPNQVCKVHAAAQIAATVMAKAAARCRQRGAPDPSDGLDRFPADFVERFAAVGEDRNTLLMEARSAMVILALNRGDVADVSNVLKEAERGAFVRHERIVLINLLIDHARERLARGRISDAVVLLVNAMRLSRSRAFRRLIGLPLRTGASADGGRKSTAHCAASDDLSG